jgi:hypothetical protein
MIDQLGGEAIAIGGIINPTIRLSGGSKLARESISALEELGGNLTRRITDRRRRLY